jgi:energy-coupling factor transporter ATP-binding protein EcfA2
VSLPDDTWALLTAALESYRDHPAARATLQRVRERFDEPLRIAITGPPGSGKSTLLDALRVDRIRPYASLVEAADGDAVLYLTPSVADRPAPDPGLPPVHAIMVLSRADESSGARIDALSGARMLARRYQRDASVVLGCQAVVAVSGLLGLAGRTLRDAEFAALASLAARSRPELEPHLLSVDRFVAPGFPVPLDPAVRAGLLDRFGLAGVRLASTLIRTGAAAPAQLAAQLVARSGLTELRDAIGELFLARAPVLKARSALAALAALVRTEPGPAARQLTAELERVVASGHELRELRLLAALRSGRTTLPAELDEPARRLIGAAGTGIAARLGVEADNPDARALAADAVRHWRAEADNPRSRPDRRWAAEVVLRSGEVILAELERRVPVSGSWRPRPVR